MPRVTLVLVALAGVLAGGLGVSLYERQSTAPDEAEVRAVVERVLAESASDEPAPVLPAVTQDEINPMIETYLMSDPKILQRVSDRLDAQLKAEAADKNRAAITAMHDQIFNDPENIVVGNPAGDVTLVEMFDYNCTYCRAALPDLATLVAEDPNLKVVLKEFPILSAQSLEAARVAVLVGDSDVDYWTFHQALFTGRGPVDGQTALTEAASLGLDSADLQTRMDSQKVTGTIQKSYDIARALNITGTPSYLIGDELIQGAVGLDALRERISNMRACGKTICEG